MKTLLTFLLSGLMTVNGLTASAPATVENLTSGKFDDGLYAYATVDRIEEENWVVLEASLDDEYCIMVDVLQEDFNISKNEGDQFRLSVVHGKFYTTFLANDYMGREENYYQFRSDDNTVWWALTEAEIGGVPDNETEYTLIYYDNGTTAENKPCDCLPEWECECEVYDDIFIGMIVEKYGNILSVENFEKMIRSEQI